MGFLSILTMSHWPLLLAVCSSHFFFHNRLVTSMVYFGQNLGTGHLPGSPHLNLSTVKRYPSRFSSFKTYHTVYLKVYDECCNQYADTLQKVSKDVDESSSNIDIRVVLL